MPASPASSRCAATRRRARSRARPSSAISAAPAELVQLIHRVQAERVPFVQVPVPGFPGARRLVGRRRRCTIAVAAFPNGHPGPVRSSRTSTPCWPSRRRGRTSPSRNCSSRRTTTSRFVERATRRRRHHAILPGIMPVLSAARLAPYRGAQRRGPCPLELLRSISSRPADPAARSESSMPPASRPGCSTAAPPDFTCTPSTAMRPPLAVLGAVGLLRFSKDTRMTDAIPPFPTGTILGYPRIGPRRELKKRRRSVLGGQDRRRGARGDGSRPARRDAGAAGLARSRQGATRRSPRRSRYYDQVLDAAVTVGAMPDAVRRPGRRRRLARPGRLLHPRARRGRPGAAGDDQVVRLQLPLPGARDRARTPPSSWRAIASSARSPRPGRRLRHPARSSSAP